MKHSTCGSLIKMIHDNFERKANNALRPQGLTAAQGSALLHVFNESDGQMTLKELERRMHVAQSTAAGIVVRLEQKGLIECFGDPSDRRIKCVRITESGKNCCRIGSAHVSEVEDRLFSCLSEDEQRELLRLLDKVCSSIE